MSRFPRRLAEQQLDLVAAIAYAEPGAQLDLVEEAGVEVLSPRSVQLPELALFPLEV